MLNSDYRKLCAVTLPYAGRQMYMHTFDLASPVMARGYEDYLIPVCALINAAGAFEGEAHMTVDEKVVKAGMSQRRPFPHVDGCFYPNEKAVERVEKLIGVEPAHTFHGWGHGTPSPAPVRSGAGWGHSGSSGGGWNHTCNNIALDEFKRMPVIVASSVPGCRVWRGKFKGEPKDDGDLSHIKLGKGKVLPAGVGFLFSPDCVHESMIQEQDIQRTFLRIALPTTFKF